METPEAIQEEEREEMAAAATQGEAQTPGMDQGEIQVGMVAIQETEAEAIQGTAAIQMMKIPEVGAAAKDASCWNVPGGKILLLCLLGKSERKYRRRQIGKR
ncbi:hypothetical protein [Rhodococcus rhodochrous]|uniref:hypothetical protein n=1 Tax=Rhodococcus rhodochrous TaxID=1829 RepID=UPI0003632DBD|nr:hypothetical protein [Rhodococcus rhodochrous]